MARRLNTILVDMGYLDEETMWDVTEEAKRQGVESIGKVAVAMGKLTEEKYLKALGEFLGMKVVSLGDMTIPREVADVVNETMAKAFKVVPISVGKKDKVVTVAMA